MQMHLENFFTGPLERQNAQKFIRKWTKQFNVNEAVSQFMQLGNGFILRRPGFNPAWLQVRFMVGKWQSGTGTFFSELFSHLMAIITVQTYLLHLVRFQQETACRCSGWRVHCYEGTTAIHYLFRRNQSNILLQAIITTPVRLSSPCQVARHVC
jgi:hypothetical protein